MPRRTEDYQKCWKIFLPATLAGKLEFMLRDPIHNKPIYGARARLFESLASRWIAEQEGRPTPPVVSLDELRSL